MTAAALKILLASVVAGVLSLDRNAFGQFQLSRPMVSAFIMGLILGRPVEGAILGLIYELLFLASLPVGSFIPYHPLFPCLVSVLLVCMYDGHHPAIQILGLAVLLGAPTAYLDRQVNIQWRRSNERAFQRARVYLRLGRTDLVQFEHVMSAVRAGFFHGGSYLLTGLVLVPVFNFVMENSRYLPERLAVVAMLPFLIGLAAMASDRTSKKGWIGFTAGLFAGASAGILRTLL